MTIAAHNSPKGGYIIGGLPDGETFHVARLEELSRALAERDYLRTLRHPKRGARVKQKFVRGDLVQLAEIFPPNMQYHHGRGELAIVSGSYADQFGDGPPAGYHHDEFTLFLLGEVRGNCSWYSGSLLTLVKPRCIEHLDILDGIQPHALDPQTSAFPLVEWFASHAEAAD